MVNIREAAASDAIAAVAVLRRSINELCQRDHKGDSDTIAKWLANKTPEAFTAWVADADNFCVVAETDEGLMGVGMLHRSGEIRLCYLAPGMQGQGVGKRILWFLEERALRWGLHKLRLESTVAARPFYERAGYRAAGATPNPGFGLSRCYPYEKELSA